MVTKAAKGFVFGVIVTGACLFGPSQAFAALELKLGDVDPPESPFVIAEMDFAKKVREKTGGRINITVYHSGQLGNDQAIADGVRLGTIHMAVAGTTGADVLNAFFLPYVFADGAHQRRVMSGEIGKALKEKFNRDTGMVLIGGAYFPARHLTTRNREVRSPADLKGLRVRVPQIPAMMATWKALGASPTPINVTELFSALQQGTVDAQENPFINILFLSIPEVCKYMILTGHVVPMRFLFVNGNMWKTLPKEDQDFFVKTWGEEAVLIEKMYEDNEQKWLGEIKAKGMTVIEVDKAPFRAAVKDVWKEFAPKAWGEGVYEKIQAMR